MFNGDKNRIGEGSKMKACLREASMKCRSEKHPYHAEGGEAGPAALRCRRDGWRWDSDGGGLEDGVLRSRALLTAEILLL